MKKNNKTKNHTKSKSAKSTTAKTIKNQPASLSESDSRIFQSGDVNSKRIFKQGTGSRRLPGAA